ncbi:Hypothetical predicted protein [Marmota monax]|uniref:Uncharacterized protein n=1 Tax=Marmota monax TaxID=9995 RepID=A0A5E4BXZ1_MARMO|nr:Hypothetical predicted protein [Marmota monax]
MALAPGCGACGGCFLDPANIRANTKHQEAEFQLPELSPRGLLLGAYTYRSLHRAQSGRVPAPGTVPEPPWLRAAEPAEAASWTLLLSEHTPSTKRPNSGSRN